MVHYLLLPALLDESLQRLGYQLTQTEGLPCFLQGARSFPGLYSYSQCD